MDALLVWSGPVLELAVLAGLIVRRRVRRAWLLPAFLTAVLATNSAVALVPTLATWDFWLIKEAAHALLLLGLGLEVSARMLKPLPGAALLATLLGLGVVAATGVVLHDAPRQYLLFELIPRVLAGTAGLYIVVFLVQAVFIVPVDPLHKAILLGLSPYMLVYAITWGRVGSLAAGDTADLVNRLMAAFALLMLLEAAWKHEGAPPAPARLVRRLWPWR